MFDFDELSLELTKSIDKDTKKQQGIFFTPKTYRDVLLNTIREYITDEVNTILEPSFGSGEFIKDLSKLYPKSFIFGVELNKLIFDKVNSEITQENISLYNEDFLHKSFDLYFDLIIGNPPYIVVSNIQDSQYNEYVHIGHGRHNLFCMFIYKSIQLLKHQGILGFIVPKSILNTSYYEKIRIFIQKNCKILNIIELSTSRFIDTQQQTILLILKKDNNDNKDYIISHKNKVYFNKYFKDLSFQLDKYPCLKDLGFLVKTGSIVWNQNKSILKKQRNDDTYLLIYSSNIKNNKFVYFDDKIKNDKKQYIEIKEKEVVKGPVILINRGFGNCKYNFNCIYLDENFEKEKGFLVENHLNIIYTTNSNNKHLLLRIYDFLLSKENIDYIDKFIGNGSMNKTEIETLLPIQI